jgi:hypothetical protein
MSWLIVPTVLCIPPDKLAPMPAILAAGHGLPYACILARYYRALGEVRRGAMRESVDQHLFRLT